MGSTYQRSAGCTRSAGCRSSTGPPADPSAPGCSSSLRGEGPVKHIKVCPSVCGILQMVVVRRRQGDEFMMSREGDRSRARMSDRTRSDQTRPDRPSIPVQGAKGARIVITTLQQVCWRPERDWGLLIWCGSVDLEIRCRTELISRGPRTILKKTGQKPYRSTPSPYTDWTLQKERSSCLERAQRPLVRLRGFGDSHAPAPSPVVRS